MTPLRKQLAESLLHIYVVDRESAKMRQSLRDHGVNPKTIAQWMSANALLEEAWVAYEVANQALAESERCNNQHFSATIANRRAMVLQYRANAERLRETCLTEDGCQLLFYPGSTKCLLKFGDTNPFEFFVSLDELKLLAAHDRYWWHIYYAVAAELGQTVPDEDEFGVIASIGV